MVIASGYIEANELNDVDRIVTCLRVKGVEVDEINDEKIVYLVERQTHALLKKEIESLKDIEGVRNVYLTYFSLDESEDTTT